MEEMIMEFGKHLLVMSNQQLPIIDKLYSYLKIRNSGNPNEGRNQLSC